MIAALDEARRLMAEDPTLAADAMMVVILPDGGRSYMSKLYNDEWMRANGLLATTGAVIRIEELLAGRQHELERPALVLARTTESVGQGDRDPPGVRHQPDAGLGGRRWRCRCRHRRLDQ